MSNRSTVMFLTGPDSSRLAAAPFGWSLRVGARLRAPNLDRRLAGGDPPESDRWMAARARILTSPQQRRLLARRFESLLAPSPSDGTGRSRVPLDRRSIEVCEGAIRDVVAALDAAVPVTAQGVAAAARLLGDGSGPLYAVRHVRPRASRLDEVLHHIRTQLDPTLSPSTAEMPAQRAAGKRSR